MGKKMRQREHRTKAAWIIKKLGHILQVGGTRAFILYQVVAALGNLHLDNQEIEAMSRAVSPFADLAQKRRFASKLREELSGCEWQANFRQVV